MKKVKLVIKYHKANNNSYFIEFSLFSNLNDVGKIGVDGDDQLFSISTEDRRNKTNTK